MVKKPWQQDAEERDKDSPKKKAKLTEFAGRHGRCDGRFNFVRLCHIDQSNWNSSFHASSWSQTGCCSFTKSAFSITKTSISVLMKQR